MPRVMKDNSDFNGEWQAKSICNPEHKGVREVKKIDNPEFVNGVNCLMSSVSLASILGT